MTIVAKMPLTTVLDYFKSLVGQEYKPRDLSLGKANTYNSTSLAVFRLKHERTSWRLDIVLPSFRVRTFLKYKNIPELMILKERKDFTLFKQRDFIAGQLFYSKYFYCY